MNMFWFGGLIKTFWIIKIIHNHPNTLEWYGSRENKISLWDLSVGLPLAPACEQRLYRMGKEGSEQWNDGEW